MGRTWDKKEEVVEEELYYEYEDKRREMDYEDVIEHGQEGRGKPSHSWSSWLGEQPR